MEHERSTLENPKMNSPEMDHSKMDHSKMNHSVHGAVPMGMKGHDHHKMMIKDFKK